MGLTVHAAVGYLRSLLVCQRGNDCADRNLLIRFLATRDGDAFAVLVQRHGPRVLGVARRVGGEAHADDVFQATFLLLARQAHTLHRPEALGSWLARTAFRLALRARQSQDRRAALESHITPPVSRTPLDELSGRELLAVLDEELRQLPDRVRWPLVLCCLEGLSQEEAARVIGCSPGAVRGRLERGRARLRQRLTARGLTLPATLAAVLVIDQSASAVPPTLRDATLKAVIHGGASPSVNALVRGATTMMLLGHLKATALSMVLIAALGAGVTAWLYQGAPAPADAPSPTPPAAKTDLYGDPLPEGAVVRMGSVRLRHAGLSEFVFLADGKTILSAGSDRVLRFWDTTTGQQTRAVTLQGKAGPGRAVTLSPDGKTLAAHDQGAIVFWEVESGKEIKTIPAPKTNVAYLTFSHDGKTLAVGTGDWRFLFWEWETGKERQIRLPITDPRNFEYSLDSTFHGSYSADGKWFVAGAQAMHPLGVFEAATGREAHRLDCHARTSTVSPDGKRLAVCGWQIDKGVNKSFLAMFDLESGKELAQYPLEDNEYYFMLAFSPDGKTLACSFSDQSCLRDVASGRVLHRLSRRPIQATFTPDGKTLVASTGHRLRFWDVASGKEFHDRPGEFGYRPVLAASPDGRLLASGDWSAREVSLWDASTGRLVRQFPLKEDEARYVRNLSFSADGRALYAGQRAGFLPSWDVVSGKERGMTRLIDPNHPNKGSVYFYQLHVASDGKRAMTLERIFQPKESTRLAVWETATGLLLHQHMFQEEVREAAWSSDGTTVALPLKDGLALVEADTGMVRFQVAGTVANGPLSASPDGRLLACAKDESKSVGVWEAITGKEVATVATGRVAHLALNADNRCLVTTDAECLRVWDVATGKERRRWPLPNTGTDSWGKTFVFALALSPDGRRAFTSLADGTALVWDLEPALKPAEPLVKDAGEKEVAGWWTDLTADDAGKAYAAVWRLAEAREETVMTLLRQHLKPAAALDPKAVQKLVAELDSETFAVRDKAFKELEGLGIVAVPALKQVLTDNPSAEVRRRLETLVSRVPDPTRSPELLRRLRAIQVLERVASKDARRLLAELAGGIANALGTQAAQAAQERLARRSTAP